MTTDNRTNEPTEAQVERAKRAFYAHYWMPSDAGYEDDREEHEKLDESMRAALVAAQGAAPQAECSERPWNDPSDPNSPQFDSPWEKAAALIQSIRGAQWDMLERREQADVRDEINGLIDRLDELATTMLAAPVLPSSTVDEALRFCTCSHWLEAHHERKCLEHHCACVDFQPVLRVDEDALAEAWDRGANDALLSEGYINTEMAAVRQRNPYRADRTRGGESRAQDSA